MVAVSERTEIRPQPGPQERVLACPADILISGGAAGGGKTFGLLLDPLRFLHSRRFSATIFRRTNPQLEQQGGIWETARDLYPQFGGVATEGKHLFTFPSGMVVKFAHLQQEKHSEGYRGSQLPFIGFDELPEFTERQFWYMFSRNRDPYGVVHPYIRATCNPDPDSFVAGLVEWWIDQDTGYAIPERSGVVRWFTRMRDEITWADSRDACIAATLKKFPGTPERDLLPKSFTFIPSNLDDNPALLEGDPSYRANLNALSYVERERLLNGNWKIRPTAGNVFNRAWFKSIPALPVSGTWVRYWDKAGTDAEDNPGAAFTCGALVGRMDDGRYIVGDVKRGQWSALERENVIRQTADADRERFGNRLVTWIEQEPGSGGKESAEATVRNLGGHRVYPDRVTGSKIERAQPLSAQAEAGNVWYVVGPWNDSWLSELHAFPDAKLKDQADATSGAFNKVAKAAKPYDPDDWNDTRG